LFGRIAAWRRREELDAELAEEMEAHIELLARDLERDGTAPRDALARARRQVGNVTLLREQSRDAWGFPTIERILQDVRYALRGLRLSPGFTVTAIATLGLGIGANAAMFGVIDRLMFRPFPYLRDPGSVHRVYLETTYNGRTNSNTVFPYTRYLDLVRGIGRFAEYAAVSEWRFGVGGGDGEDVRVRKVAGVSASFFDFFDAPPVLGRYFFDAEDTTPMGALVAVIGYTFWRTDLASGDVVGRNLKVGRLDYTIVGVAPERFVGTVSGGAPDVFVPITTIAANLGPWNQSSYFTTYSWDWTEVLVRRRPGVSVEAASADLGQAYVRSRAAARALNPRVMADSLARPRAIAGPVKTAAGPGAGPEAKVLLWVTGVAGIVLLIACASVANLMLTRVIRRRREITVRLALGVSRSRLVAQFVTEIVVLALLGAVAGLVIAQWSGIAIRSLLLPEGSPFNLFEDWRTIGVALACAATCTLLTAIAPALVATRSDLAVMLKSGAREGTHQRSRLQTGLLVFQVSLSVMLLVGAALFVKSFGNARALPLGYDARPVLEVFSDFRDLELDDSAGAIARTQLLAAAQALPGVDYAAAINSRLFRTNTAELRVDGIDSVAALGRFNFQAATEAYFDVMQMRILRGRGLESRDRAGTPLVTVVSESMGRVLWPGRDPIGECIRVSIGDGSDVDTVPCTTVVGIAQNTMQQNLTDDPMYMYYLPAEQVLPGQQSTMLLRMSGGSALSQMERVRRELTRAMPGDGFVVVRPLQEVVDDKHRSWRLGATLFVAFGGLAFIVAVVGLYGVISYDVAGRMHELGVRIALGAQPGSVVRLVVTRGTRFAVAGSLIGLGFALGAARWVQPLLFHESASDPATYAFVGGAMVLVAVSASLVPALRASRADPAASLRAE
jgi:predicted permease